MGALRIESAFSIFILSAPLCGGEVVRVEVQNVGDILLRKPVVLVDCGHAVNELNHLQHVTTARKPVTHVRTDTIRFFSSVRSRQISSSRSSSLA